MSCIVGRYLMPSVVLTNAFSLCTVFPSVCCTLIKALFPLPCSGKAASGRDTLDNDTETGSVVSQRREREKPRKKHNNDHGQQGLRFDEQRSLYSCLFIFLHYQYLCLKTGMHTYVNVSNGVEDFLYLPLAAVDSGPNSRYYNIMVV